MILGAAESMHMDLYLDVKLELIEQSRGKQVSAQYDGRLGWLLLVERRSTV